MVNQIQHFSHEHPMLTYRNRFDVNDDWHVSSRPVCVRCLVPLDGICYSCSHCPGFKLHLLCATAVDSSAKQIQHCTHHEHPLTYFEDLPPNISSVNCQLCSEGCDGDLFLCLPCKHKGNGGFWLHKRCAELARQITLPRHNPDHKLIMSAQDLDSDYYVKKGSPCPQLCGNCVVPLSFTKLSYSCSHCDFALHPLCASSSSAEDHQGAYENNKQVSSSFKHTAHHHDLVLYEMDKVTKMFELGDIACAWCGDLVLPGMFYACLTCGFHLHEGCTFDMPGDQIIHPFHQQHSLLLTVDKTDVGVICFVCGDVLDNRICFTCEVCDNLIGLHARCASGLLRVASNFFKKHKHKQIQHLGKSVAKIQHFAHAHPLVYGTKSQTCQLCWADECDGGGFFYCESCKGSDSFTMHRRCVEQPEEITHPWHPNHKLTLFCHDYLDRNNRQLCNECFVPLSRLPWSYCCLHCDFNLHFSCAMAVAGGSQLGSKKVSRFKHTAHHHDLILYQRLDKITQILPQPT